MTNALSTRKPDVKGSTTNQNCTACDQYLYSFEGRSCREAFTSTVWGGVGDALDIISLDRAPMEECLGGKVTGGYVRRAPHACLV